MTAQRPPLPPFTREDLKTPGYIDALCAVDGGYLFEMGGRPGRRCIVQHASLVLLDARLPGVAHQLTSGEYPTSSTLSGAALSASLRYWDNPAPIVMEEFLQSTHVLEVITEVREDLSDINMFSVLYRYLDIVTTNNLDFVRNMHRQAERLSYDWCEQHFPGSVARLKAALALDMASQEIAQFGFYAKTALLDASLGSTLPPSLTEHLP